jgi:hypothetical protein
MEIIDLIAKIQANPRNIVAYRKLAEQFKHLGMEHEHEAFQDLIRQKFSNNTHINEKQRQDDP